MNTETRFLEVRKRLYKDIYDAELRLFNIDLSSWRNHPYTKLKSYYYIELGAILTYFLLRTKITPNTITLFYAALGIIAAILILLDYKFTLYLALFIWFSKAVPDWIDGHIARIKGQTSKIGALLDGWGAHVNMLSFQAGIGLYVAINSEKDIYYILSILILLSAAVNFRSYIYEHIDKAVGPLGAPAPNNPEADNSSRINIKKIKLVANILRYDGRSRYTDLVLLVVLLETWADKIVISALLVWLWAIINISYLGYTLLGCIRDQDDILS